MATVYFDEATRRFTPNDPPAVDAVTPDIADGEFLLPVGPSGCGQAAALRQPPRVEADEGGPVPLARPQQEGGPPREREWGEGFPR